MKTLAIANAKGGTGKTTLAVHLATGLARQGKRVLLVDLDPQASATSWLLGIGHDANVGTAEALLSKRIEHDHIRPIAGRDGLFLMPATTALAASEDVISRRPLAHLTLGKVLRGVAGSYDFAILDCPPAAGFYVVSALCAADGVVAPVLGAFLSLAGLRRLEEVVAEVREGLDSTTQVLGYVLFAADPREAITAEAREILGKEAGGKLYKAEVRVSTAAKALPARRETAWDAGADPRGAEDYPAIMRETLERLDGRRQKGA